MAYSSPPPPTLQPPPSPLPQPPQPPSNDATLTLSLAPPSSQPLAAWAAAALPSSPRSAAAAFPRVRSSPATGETPPCTECGKRFPSWKALFGHMRCHPERQWRGITPPPHFLRGQGGEADNHQFTSQEREVATVLLMLAGPRAPGATGKRKKSLLGGGGGTSASPSSPTAAPAMSKCDAADYRCSVCHKGFASGQALGGHKRLHWQEPSSSSGEAVPATSSGMLLPMPEPDDNAATALDLNLAPPPGPPPLPTDDQAGSTNAMLDLKLGY